jgi:hypothetical protein
MGYVIYTKQSEAGSLQTDIDTVNGWPKVGAGVCQRVHVGGGRHVEHPACCTFHEVDVVKHPDLAQWAVPIPDDYALDVAVIEVELTADWSKDPTK